MVDQRLDPGRAAEHGFQIRKNWKGIEIGMHKAEIFNIRQVPDMAKCGSPDQEGVPRTCRATP
jgi:hypothetical protein